MRVWYIGYVLLMGIALLALTACSSSALEESSASSANVSEESEQQSTRDEVRADAQPVEIKREPDVPDLPFADNADPALCGIPEPWGSHEPAYLSGVYEGELIQPTVFLYDSHLRRKIQAKAPHGAEVKILLSQSNPSLDYYLVKVVGAEQPNEGWVPAPFLSFEPPPPVEAFAAAEAAVAPAPMSAEFSE